MVHEVTMAWPVNQPASPSAVAREVMEPEAGPLRGALARVKAARLNDGRVADIAVIEKVKREMLRALSM